MSSTYTPGEKVDLIIIRETDLGFVAQINGTDEGLLYHDEIFERLDYKQSLPGYIKKIRPDGAIDLMLQSFGTLGSEELGQQIIEALKFNNGFISVNAKSPAEEIYNMFGISRKKFKIALGSLYKNKIVTFTEEGTKLIPQAES